MRNKANLVGRGPAIAGLEIAECGLENHRKTNPICPGRAGTLALLCETKPNYRLRTADFGLRIEERESDCAKQSQFGGPGTGDCGLGIAECGLENDAKRTQFAPGPAGTRGHMADCAKRSQT